MLLLGGISTWWGTGRVEILTRGYGGEYDAANALVEATKE